jgi:hypothetical protein
LARRALHGAEGVAVTNQAAQLSVLERRLAQAEAQIAAMLDGTKGLRTVFSQTIALADDEAASIILGSAKHALVLVVGNWVGSTSPRGVYYAETATPTCANVAMVTTTDVAFATGALSGTTGVDAKFTLSAHTDGKLYFENRSGAARTLDVLVVSAP